MRGAFGDEVCDDIDSLAEIKALQEKVFILFKYNIAF